MDWLKNKVYEKYPVTKGERECAVERRMMNKLRDAYRSKLEKQAANDQRAQKPDEVL